MTNEELEVERDNLKRRENLKRSPLLKELILSLGRAKMIEIAMKHSGNNDINAYEMISNTFLAGYVIDAMEVGTV